MAQKRGESAMGGKKSKAHKKTTGKKPHELHIRRSANGGYISKHIHKPVAGAEPPEPEEHTLPDIGSLQEHVGEHMAPEEGAGGAPQGAPGGMPQMPGM